MGPRRSWATSSTGMAAWPKIWADAGYAGALVAWVKALRPRGPLHRAIVWRRNEAKTQHVEAMLYITMIPLMLHRLAGAKPK